MYFDNESNEHIFIPYKLKPFWPKSHVGQRVGKITKLFFSSIGDKLGHMTAK